MEQQLTPAALTPNSNNDVVNTELDRSLSAYDYELPPELIAQNPAIPRDSSRLLVVNSRSIHHIFRDLPHLLKAGDLLVMNNTSVIPARLYGRKATGAEIEVLLLEERQYNCWLALVKPGKRFKVGSKIIFEPRGALKQGSKGAGEMRK